MLKKILMLFILSISLLFITSCSAFMGSDEGLMIENIVAEYNEEDGSTKITITFTDEDEAEVTFTIPKGEQGETGLAGVGIESIEETENNTLLITFTDETTKEVPLDLEDITNIYSTYKPNEHTTTVTIETNKNKYEFNVNDPLGISNITNSIDGTTGNILLEISMTDGTKKEIIIPKGEKGDTGLGIESIVASENNLEYILTITYTDGQTNDIVFTKPKSTIWYSGNGEPNNMSLGIFPNDGDFYFDKANFRFYQYDGMFSLSWELVADLGLSGDTCQVTFNATANGGSIITGNNVITCQRGDYVALSDIPIAYKEGYKFVGWYTSKSGNTNVNAERFTDLTPVLSNLTLYACFVEISE